MDIAQELRQPEHVRRLSEEERAVLEKRRQEIFDAKDEAGLSRYKIELMLGKDFSLTKPSSGMMAFFENANHLRGDGDSIIHFCPGKKLGKNDCDHHIPDPSHGFGFLVCPRCKSVWNGDQVYGQFVAKLPPEKWAELFYKYYVKLDMRCDLIIKHHKEDIRHAAYAQHAQDALRTARGAQKRIRRIYSMSAIIKDTSAGADLFGRILAFVRA